MCLCTDLACVCCWITPALQTLVILLLVTRDRPHTLSACYCQLGVVSVRRFDLLHVMLDELTEEDDGRIAAHIVALHKDPAATIGRAPFTMEQLQRFIKYARSIKPRITPEVGRDSVGAAWGWSGVGCFSWSQQAQAATSSNTASPAKVLDVDLSIADRGQASAVYGEGFPNSLHDCHETARCL